MTIIYLSNFLSFILKNIAVVVLIISKTIIPTLNPAFGIILLATVVSTCFPV